MDWRPFAACYAPNTFESFCKRVDLASLDVFKPKAKTHISLYRPTAQDVEAEFQKFEDLRKKVTEQRKLIKEKDDCVARYRAVQKEQLLRKLQEAKRTRKQFTQHVRSFAGNRTRTLSPLSSLPRAKTMTDPRRGEDSSFFALTVVDPVTETSQREERKSLRRSLLPTIRGLRDYSQPSTQRSKVVS